MKQSNTSPKSFSSKKNSPLFILCLIMLMILSAQNIFAQTVSLGNTIWWDMNDNGKKDAAEFGTGGIPVVLYQDNDNNGVADAGFTALTTYTNSTGGYLFSNLAPGSYFVVVGAGNSHYKTTVYGGDPDNNIDGDNNGHTQNLTDFYIYSKTITLSSGSEPDGTGASNTNINNTYDMGMWKGNGLGDMVWLDNNGNGVQETGEPGMANVMVKLKNNSGTVLATTTTDANGFYSFHNPQGYGTNNYQVEFVTPTGYLPTTANKAGADDAMDSDPVNGIIASVNVPAGTWDHSFDAGFVPEGNTLPVKIYSFTANLNYNKVDLKWITASEINVSHFVVEKSTDGVTFNEAGLVFANGNATDKTNYSLSDNIIEGKSTVIYYRLRSMDVNGKSELSETRIIRISKQTENGISIVTYPNPVSNEVRITIPANWQNKKVVYELFSANGKAAKRIETANSSQTETINVSSLSPGFYIVRVSFDGQTAMQKIIKQ